MAQVSGLGFGAINYLVRQALASEAFDRKVGALLIVIAKANAGVLAKIEPRQIAVQVLAIDVPIDAPKAALLSSAEVLTVLVVLARAGAPP